MRPTSTRIKRTTRISPTVPLGTYPQLRLCGHVGSTPTSIRIRITSKIVPIATSFASGLFQFQMMPRPGVLLLDRSHQLVSLASDRIEIVIRELPPPLPYLAAHLLPLAFKNVRVHATPPRFWACAFTASSFRKTILPFVIVQ